MADFSPTEVMQLDCDSPRLIETPLKQVDVSNEDSPGYSSEHVSPAEAIPVSPTHFAPVVTPPFSWAKKYSGKRPPHLSPLSPTKNATKRPDSDSDVSDHSSVASDSPPGSPQRAFGNKSPSTPVGIINTTPARCPDTPDRSLLRKRNTKLKNRFPQLSVLPCSLDLRHLPTQPAQDTSLWRAASMQLSRRASTPVAMLDSPSSTGSLKAKPSFCGRWSGMMRRKSSLMSPSYPMSPMTPMTPMTPATPLTPSRYLEHFEEECELGRGSFGIVVKARSRRDGRVYAIKSCNLNGEMHMRMAQQEVATLASCDNPHIIKYYDSWVEGTRFFVQTECCEGSAVQQWPLGSSFWDDAQLLRLMYQISTALHSLHARGLAHMDVKPENIYVSSVVEDRLPMYKLGDFGLVRATNPESADAALYCADMEDMEGDPRYLASEVLHTHNFLCEADIFALGASVYELARSEPLPGHGDDWHAIRSGRPLPGIAHCSPSLVGLLHRTVHPNPTARPSALRLLCEIQQIADSTNMPDVLRGTAVELPADRD